MGKKKFEKLYVNGNFYSFNEKKIEYLGVSQGKIEAMGSLNDLDCIHECAREVIDLEGKSVYPGFTDAHLHLIAYAQKKCHEVSLSDCTSKEDMVKRIKVHIVKNDIQPGEWVIGAGWNQELFQDKSYPDRHLLDDVTVESPVFLIRTCYHICVVNSVALKECGIDANTSFQDGGKIDKDQQGEPTGVLRENAMSLVTNQIPSIHSKDKLKALILEGCQDLASLGITTVHADDFSFIEDKKMLWQAYEELAQENALPLRVILQLRVASLEDIVEYKDMGMKSWMDINRLRIGPVKIIADGSLGSRTAALEEAYSDDLNNRGILLNSEKEYDEMISESFKNNFDMCVHAIGDRAMKIILNNYQKYKKLYKKKGFRPSIIHCQIASEEILEKFKTLDIIANIQPVFVSSDWRIIESRVGAKRLKYCYSWKKYFEKGIKCAGSSDAPVESFNPIYGIHAAVNRQDLAGMPKDGWIPEEKLSLKEAIYIFTTGAAFLSHEEDLKGNFEIGKYADFVVLSDDLFEINEEQIKDVIVEKTIVGGNLFTKKDSLRTAEDFA